MELLMNDFVLLAGGIKNLQQTVVGDWIGPAFFILLAAVSIALLIGRKLREALILGVVAIVVGIYVFAGDALFGSGGTLTKATKNVVESGVNAVQVVGYNLGGLIH